MSFNFTIHTNARLHLGIFSDPRPEGRLFQGLGLMIDQPGFKLNFKSNTSPQIEFSGAESWIKTWKNLLSKLNTMELPDLKIHVAEEIPIHQGLGSGTQFAYAVLYGILHAQGHQEITVEYLRKITGRGQRSSIGSQGFFHGGFWTDQGHHPEHQYETQATRLEFPAEWRIVLFLPKIEQGLSGKKEQEAFALWPEFNSEELDELLRLSQQIIPEAILEHDFDKFSESIVEYGRLVGQSFAMFQGGIFSAAYGNIVDEKVKALGYKGVVQSSWGPILCLFVEDQVQADGVVHKLECLQAELPCIMKIVQAANKGAKFL